MKIINPVDVVPPASKYAQGIVHSATAERLVISGQIGMRLDRTIEEGMEAQMERAWNNLFGVLRAAGFEKRHLVKVTIFVTERGSVGTFRDVRDRMLAGHECACTYLEIAGLAAPQLLVEIEGEAVKD